MPIQTKEEAQDKVSNKIDKNFKKIKKQVPLSEEKWSDLNQRGATLAEQFEWIKLKKKEKRL
jgi:hypothetical protein